MLFLLMVRYSDGTTKMTEPDDEDYINGMMSKKDNSDDYAAGYNTVYPIYSGSPQLGVSSRGLGLKDDEKELVKPVESAAKRFIDFFNVASDDENEWSGMRNLAYPISFYSGRSAGSLRETYGCVIPSHIPDEANVSCSSHDVYYFSWYEGNEWCYSKKIEL